MKEKREKICIIFHWNKMNVRARINWEEKGEENV